MRRNKKLKEIVIEVYQRNNSLSFGKRDRLVFAQTCDADQVQDLVRRGERYAPEIHAVPVFHRDYSKPGLFEREASCGIGSHADWVRVANWMKTKTLGQISDEIAKV